MYLSIVYAIGAYTLVFSEIKIPYMPESTLALTGLALIGMTSGGLRSLIVAFGGDQFKLPEQIHELSDFFSMYYFAINFGSLLGALLIWNLRMHEKCFKILDCHATAFLLSAIMLTTGICKLRILMFLLFL